LFTLPPVNVGSRVNVTARAFSLEGEGLADLDGHVLHCSGLFPGEQAVVRIDARSRQHPRVWGTLFELTRAHPARRPPPCPNHEARGGACDGCALMGLDEGAQRALKREMLRTQFGLEVREVEAAPAPLGYRYASKRVALRDRHGLVLGSYARKSHRPAAMDGCLVDHPRLARAFDQVQAAARASGVEAYDERTRRGDLRYVWGKTNGREVIVTLITAADDSRAARVLPERLPEIDGLLWSVQASAGNNMRGAPARPLRGISELKARLLDQPLELGALGFLQPNPKVAERAYLALVELDETRPVPELAYDLYAGAGVTTRKLRERVREVVPCESYPESAAALGVPAQTVEAFLEQALRAGVRTPDLVVANPPRKGMGEAVCSALLKLGAPELRIMSCGPQGLARDLAALAARYALIELRAFDTLPQTPHVELVAKLQLRT
jgi:23S rRNA (uracil1939-C5)-methyltransferase